MRKFLLSFFVIFYAAESFSQLSQSDSATILEPVMVSAFEQHALVSRTPMAIKALNPSAVDWNNKTSLLSGFNGVAGVRMEERSPASYRINIRGSSLRSPFGVRNVKVYWNELPVTDPGGNTYFNQFAFNNFSAIEIYKGPVSSMYGAGTGGLILMRTMPDHFKPFTSVEYMTGSHDLQNIFGTVAFGNEQNHSLVTYAHNASDGYRHHSSMRRDNASFVSQNKLSDRQQLTASVLFTDLYYETPGGLNKTEFKNSPSAARPAAGGLPSADQCKAAIFQKNFLAGLNQQYQFDEHFQNSTSVYGAFAQIKNPTFRNYERRNEPHFGGRTSFIYHTKMSETAIQLVAGSEVQQGFFNTQVSKNKNGNPDSLQTDDDIRFNNYSIFFQADADINQQWLFSTGISVNRSTVQFSRLNKYPISNQSRTYNSEWSPRLAILRKVNRSLSIYANVTKGFSPPTIAELLPSTGVISTFLEAEEGTNYEGGAKWNMFNGQLYVEAAAFYFRLKNALVVRKDSSNADYYVNAGDIREKGAELSADYNKIFTTNSVLDRLTINSAYTLSEFHYGQFKKDTIDYSRKVVPGVPRHTVSVQAHLQLRNGAYIKSNWYWSSAIFLDDANSTSANAYHLLGLRMGWQFSTGKKIKLNVYAGVDNLLDETYSLGNDINAAGGRYYNPASKRNYYAGISFDFRKKQ